MAVSLGCKTLFRMRLYGNEPKILPGGWIRTGETEWMFIKDFEQYAKENSCSHHYHLPLWLIFQPIGDQIAKRPGALTSRGASNHKAWKEAL